MTKRQGILTYGQRAFMEDADLAIQGDLVRALIELITNADDAYDASGGPIEIFVRKGTGDFKLIVSIHDKATGLGADRMHSAFTNMGDQNKKFVEDKGTRGLFGRGAKDVAYLGKAVFESVHNGKYSMLEIKSDMTYIMDTEDISAKEEHYRSTHLNPGESGLTSTLYIAARHKIPSPTELVEKLQKHSQLRDLIVRNSVLYVDERNTLKIQLKSLQPSGKKVLEKIINIPRYEMPVTLTVYELPQKDLGPVNDYSRHGLLISGKGAIYENSFLHLTSNTEAGWFSGRIDAPEIHDLARKFDDPNGVSDLNPFRLVRRSREGLVNTHLYYRALCSAIDPHLKPLMDLKAQSEGAQRKEGAELRNRFNAIESILAKQMQAYMDQEDLGQIPGETVEDNQEFELSLIPPKRLMRKGETISLTIRSPQGIDLPSLTSSIEQTEFVLEMNGYDSASTNWRQHSRLPVVDNNISVTAKTIGNSKIVISNLQHRAVCDITVVDYETPEIYVPLQMEFENDQYSVSPDKVKKIALIAPLELAGELPKIVVESKEIATTVKIGQFKPHSSGKYVESVIYLKTEVNEGATKVTGEVGNSSSDTNLSVKEQGKKKYPELKIELNGIDNPPRRVDTVREDGRLVVRMYGQHKSIRNVLGPYVGSKFKNEDTPQARATIGEVVSQQIAAYLVEREVESFPDRFTDAAAIFSRQQNIITDFVILAQAGLITE